jgi:hypothetical protein
MQRIELTNFMGPLHCPYCGQLVFRMDLEVDDEAVVAPCPHTLFIACDDGFDYRSAKFAALTKLPEDWDDDELPDNGIDGLTDSLEVAGGIKFASYVPAPCFYGTYYGFWRDDD